MSNGSWLPYGLLKVEGGATINKWERGFQNYEACCSACKPSPSSDCNVCTSGAGFALEIEDFDENIDGTLLLNEWPPSGPYRGKDSVYGLCPCSIQMGGKCNRLDPPSQYATGIEKTGWPVNLAIELPNRPICTFSTPWLPSVDITHKKRWVQCKNACAEDAGCTQYQYANSTGSLPSSVDLANSLGISDLCGTCDPVTGRNWCDSLISEVDHSDITAYPWWKEVDMGILDIRFDVLLHHEPMKMFIVEGREFENQFWREKDKLESYCDRKHRIVSWNGGVTIIVRQILQRYDMENNCFIKMTAEWEAKERLYGWNRNEVFPFQAYGIFHKDISLADLNCDCMEAIEIPAILFSNDSDNLIGQGQLFCHSDCYKEYQNKSWVSNGYDNFIKNTAGTEGKSIKIRLRSGADGAGVSSNAQAGAGAGIGGVTEG